MPEMLGLGDWGVALAYLLTLGATQLCAIYGYLNWDKPAPAEEIREIDEEVQWEKSGEQHEIERGAK